MSLADQLHESHRSNQYPNAQDRHSFSIPTDNYNIVKNDDSNSLRTMLSGISTRSTGSSIPSRTSLASASTVANTASTLRTSMGSSSSQPRQEADVATAPTQPDRDTTKAVMFCVGCWEPKGELTKHYRKCVYIQGNWAFWACPYTLEVFRDQQAFINHIKSFKPDEKRVARKQEYVTARDWAIGFSEDAKKRQLVNTIFAYFDDNPRLIEEWKALHGGELVPNLNNIADVGMVLTKSSILRRRSSLDPGHSVEEVSIDQLRQVFQVGTKTGAHAQTQPVVSSKKRQRTNTPVLYTALEIVNKDVRVPIADAHFDSAEVAQRQQQELNGQNQERSLRFGGVVVHSPSGTKALASTNTLSTACTPSTCVNQTQSAYVASNNVLSDPAEIRYNLQSCLDHGGCELPRPIPQALQQTQTASVLADAINLSSWSNDSNDYYLDESLDLDFWESLLNDPNFSI